MRNNKKARFKLAKSRLYRTVRYRVGQHKLRIFRQLTGYRKTKNKKKIIIILLFSSFISDFMRDFTSSSSPDIVETGVNLTPESRKILGTYLFVFAEKNVGQCQKSIFRKNVLKKSHNSETKKFKSNFFLIFCFPLS